jgi:16S rRNA (adenine1518-N6/adenine1519-N6)-dimethyltransferase
VGRRLGQHFLTDRSILDRIVDAIGPSANDLVLEIGPGRGTLTRRLAPRVASVVAIERDRRLAQSLKQLAAGEPGGEDPLPPNVCVIEGDALETDWGEATRRFPITIPDASPPFKVIGNIPYYITTPLIEKALTPPLPAVIVFLVQREVADRLTAAPGSKVYGALSAGVQVAAGVERLFVIRAGAFSPPPEVDSALVRLTPRDRPLVSPAEHPGFRRFLAALFGQRRKQIGRSLRSIAERSKDEAERVILEAGLDTTTRAEMLTPPELVRLYRAQQREPR